MPASAESLPALAVADLHAGYPGRAAAPEALRGVSLAIRPGRIYALLGPNGAGKTTLLRCLTGLLHPASGSIRLLGTEVRSGMPPALLGRLGVLLESPGAYDRLNAREYLRFFAGFYAIPHPEQRLEALAAALELESLSLRLGKLSQGNRRKVQLMRSLLHSPPLALWDEPTEYLDPRAQRLALDLLRAHVSQGATALVTSHRLEQMQEWADTYGFLRGGRLLHTEDRTQLDAAVDAAELEVADAFDADAASAEIAAHFRSVCAVSPAVAGLRWIATLRGPDAAEALPHLVAFAVRGGGRVLRAEPKRRTLESLYRHTVEEGAP